MARKSARQVPRSLGSISQYYFSPRKSLPRRPGANGGQPCRVLYQLIAGSIVLSAYIYCRIQASDHMRIHSLRQSISAFLEGRSLRKQIVSVTVILILALTATTGLSPHSVMATTSQPWQGFRDDLNYTSINAMVANGWTQCGQGSSQSYNVSGGSLTLQNGAAMCRTNIPTGVQNWTATARGQWAYNQHPSSSVQIVVQTTNHVYRLAAGESPGQGIVVYRDGVVIINSCATWSPYCGWYPYCVVDGRFCYYTDFGAWHVYSLNMAGGILTASFNDFVDYKYVVGSYTEPDPGTDLVMVSPSSGSDIGVVWSYVTAAPFDPTTTSVSCAPSSVAVNQATTCTATVVDTFANEAIPTGTVAFTVSGTCYAGGTYYTCPIPISSCTLGNPSATSGSCSVNYTSAPCPCYDWQTSPGTHTITATYNGDIAHPTSTGTFNLTLTPLDTTTMDVSCNPSTIVINQASSCTYTVTDTSPTPTAPTGGVNPGQLYACTLRGATTSSAICSATVIGKQDGSITIAPNYGGDLSHYKSDGGTSVTVGRRATSMVITCSPETVSANVTTTCTAIVTDTDVSAAITPTGSVHFSSNSTGTFNAPSCSLASTSNTGIARCSVAYTPTATGRHEIIGAYQSLDSSGIWEPGDNTHNGSNAATHVLVTSSDPPAIAGGGSGGGRILNT